MSTGISCEWKSGFDLSGRAFIFTVKRTALMAFAHRVRAMYLSSAQLIIHNREDGWIRREMAGYEGKVGG
jgi:hypothetical protein